MLSVTYKPFMPTSVMRSVVAPFLKIVLGYRATPTISIMTLSIMGLLATLSINDTRHNSVMSRYAECHYAECHHAKCRVF
jgi:hypothetical protein